MRSSLCRATLAVAFLSLFAIVPAFAEKHPEPSKYPITWELKFHHGLAKRIVVNIPGSGPMAYWYLTYTVTNNTDAEQQFLPLFEMVANDGKVIVADQAIPLKVFDSIKSAEGNPLLESSRKISGTIHIGEDQTREGVAIWPEPSPRMGSFTIFAGGLSGEYAMLKDDDGKPINGPDGKQAIVRKALEIDFAVWGDELYADKDEVHQKAEKWVMR